MFHWIRSKKTLIGYSKKKKKGRKMKLETRKRMKTQSAKAKGRKLQQWFTKLLVDVLGMDEEDMESRPMGSQGEDIIMGKLSRNRFPYSIECKNQEAVNVWKAYSQAEENCKGYEPLVVIKRNRSKPLVLVDAEHFVGLFKEVEDE